MGIRICIVSKQPSEADIRTGANIRAARLAKNIGQAELARRIGVASGTQVWRYETGAQTVPTAKLARIAVEVGESLDALIHGLERAERARVTPKELRDEIVKLARAALLVAADPTPEAVERFNAAVLAHARRLRPQRR